jgi:large subunit ribosomal protein L32
MPVPKKRLGHSDQGHRRSQWKATVPTVSICPHCGSPKLPHTVCSACGFYKGKVLSSKLHQHHDHE